MGLKRRAITFSFLGLLALGAAAVWAQRVKQARLDSAATYEMKLPPMDADWKSVPHGPFVREKYVSRVSGSIFTFGEAHSDASFAVAPDMDEVALAKIVVRAGELNGWKTLSVGKSEEYNGAKFVFIQRTAPLHTYWTAVGVKGNSSYVLSLTANGADEQRERILRKEYPLFRKIVQGCSLKRGPDQEAEAD